MKIPSKIASVALRKLQNLSLYRLLGRQILPGLSIREASEADLLTVYRWLNPDRELAQGFQYTSNVTNWVADFHKDLAGFVQLVRQPPDALPYTGYWLFGLYVRQRWQGLGIGEMLCRAVIERSKEEGAQTLDLLVYDDNNRAIRLYRKLSFEMFTIIELEPQLKSEHEKTGRRRVVMRNRLANKS